MNAAGKAAATTYSYPFQMTSYLPPGPQQLRELLAVAKEFGDIETFEANGVNVTFHRPLPEPAKPPRPKTKAELQREFEETMYHSAGG